MILNNKNNNDNYDYDFTLADLFKAYFDCRKNKRCKKSALRFELKLEKNLLDLYKEIKSGRYKIGKSTCFVVTNPKPREVWAANFRDRIVHHLIYNFIKDRFYKRFITDTYSCIPGRGTLKSAKRLLHFCRSATNNYTKEMFYLKADLSNFFVSINKDILFSLLKKHIREKWILSLLKQIIYNDCTKKVYVKSPPKKFCLVPSYKSLFYTDKNHGLPIGNLTSQFFSNVYLNVLDQYIKRSLKCKYYIRYVDDFVIIDVNAKILNFYFNSIKDFLKSTIYLNLNLKKKYINKISNGLDFTGYFIKPERIFLRKRTLKKIFILIKKWKISFKQYNYEILIKFFKSINSYLGMISNISGGNIQMQITNLINSLFIRINYFQFKTVVLNSAF